MKRIVKISQSKLAELLMRETSGNQGFLKDAQGFEGASYRSAEPKADILPVKKISVELSEEEITFIEDILDGVTPDNENEKQLLFNITQNLRNSLLKK